MAEHPHALYHGAHGSGPATPTGRDQHTIALLAPERAVRRVPPCLRVRALEAIPGVDHVELEAVRLQVIPEAEGVVKEIIVIGEPQALRFELIDRRGH